jgi:hypothetical protein
MYDSRVTGGPDVANTPQAVVRVDPELADAARARLGQPDASLSVLLRAGLAVLAGLPVPEALQSAATRRGPKPRAEAAA